MTRPLRLVLRDRARPTRFAKEAPRSRSELADLVMPIEHVRRTPAPGLTNSVEVGAFNEALRTLPRARRP